MMFSFHIMSALRNMCLMHLFNIQNGVDTLLTLGDAVVLVASIVVIEKRVPWWAVVPTAFMLTPISIIAWDMSALYVLKHFNLLMG